MKDVEVLEAWVDPFAIKVLQKEQLHDARICLGETGRSCLQRFWVAVQVGDVPSLCMSEFKGRLFLAPRLTSLNIQL